MEEGRWSLNLLGAVVAGRVSRLVVVGGRGAGRVGRGREEVLAEPRRGVEVVERRTRAGGAGGRRVEEVMVVGRKSGIASDEERVCRRGGGEEGMMAMERGRADERGGRSRVVVESSAVGNERKNSFPPPSFMTISDEGDPLPLDSLPPAITTRSSSSPPTATGTGFLFNFFSISIG